MQTIESRNTTQRDEPTRDATGGIAPRRVLVVDDFIDLGDAMRLLLRRHGHVVIRVCDARSALEVIETFAPEVVLLDIGVYDQHGHALIEKLRRHPSARRARLVAVSGWGREADVARTGAQVVTDALVKRAELGVLLELVATTPSRVDVEGA